MDDFGKSVTLFKAMCDPTRLQILDILSCGRLCACEILEGLNISQSTLSHHMKVLSECQLVIGEKEATWMYYSINRQTVEHLHSLIDKLTADKDECICKTETIINNKQK